MEVANTIAYYDMANITAVNIFIAQAHADVFSTKVSYSTSIETESLTQRLKLFQKMNFVKDVLPNIFNRIVSKLWKKRLIIIVFFLSLQLFYLLCRSLFRQHFL
jgi:hypothetical protein